MKTCYLLVTCSRDSSRDMMLKAVVSSFQSHPEWEKWKPDFFAFDNQSTYGDTQKFLKENLENVLLSEENYGYWSAVNWFCAYAKNKGYDFIYIIESDSVHYDLSKMTQAIDVLASKSDVGMIRTQEFSIQNRHLYDKSRRLPDSRTCEWFQQSNFFTGMPASYIRIDETDVFLTNVVAKVCGLHRIDVLLEVLSKLPVSFTELDFQRAYQQKYSINAIVDGGMYNTRLSYGPEAMAGSLVEGMVNALGYRKTREGTIDPPQNMRVNE